MNGKKSKQIRTQSLHILYEWVKTLVSPEEASKMKMEDAYKLLPKQTHIYANRKLMLSAFSLKWIVKKVKRLYNKKRIEDISLKDILNEK
tara:strand:- start:1318 stop:1587 length:270 start_codon:yes stop_codon:yes gene_type:complete